MPVSLRSRLALVAIMATFLIPIVAGNMRGLGHILTCEEVAESNFTVLATEGEDPQILSSTTLGKDETFELCGGLIVDLRARSKGDALQLLLLVTNRTELPWRGTVQLRIAGKSEVLVPIAVGKVEPGKTASDSVELKLDKGRTSIEGTLLIGP